METITLKIQDGDKFVEIIEGKYEGHLAVLKSLASGEKALFVLHKSCKDFKSTVQVIDVVQYDEGNMCAPQSVH